MPRLRVDADTRETALVEAIQNLFAASHVIDAELANPTITRAKRQVRVAARDHIHDEIERLVNIIRYRRARCGL